MELKALKNAHALEDVWVVASDASVDYFPAGFFEGRTVITVNYAHVPARYCVSKNDEPTTATRGSDWLTVEANANPDTLFVVSKHRNGDLYRPKSHVPDAVIFDHHQNQVQAFNAQTHIPDDTNMLLVSYSTIGSALHLAAFMGARTCFVAAGSGGVFGEEAYRASYHAKTTNTVVEAASRQTQPICDELQRRYGTQFVTVLPWGNLRLGGDRFEADYGRLN